MRWFFSCNEINVFGKTAMETLYCSRHTSHMIKNWMFLLSETVISDSFYCQKQLNVNRDLRTFVMETQLMLN